MKPAINAEKVNRLARTLKHVGSNFSVKMPHRVFGAQYISIGDNFNASEGLKIEAIDNYMGHSFSPQVIIGDNVTMIANCHIGCIDRISIGNNVLIASNVYISDHFHGEISAMALDTAPEARYLTSKGPVIIHDNVWIGQNVAILPGVVIGKNAIIGANAVVTKNVAPNTVAAGNPAKTIRTLDN